MKVSYEKKKKNPAHGDTLGPRVRLVYRGKIYAYIFLFILRPLFDLTAAPLQYSG